MGFGGNISDDEHLTTSGRHARKRQHRDDGENDDFGEPQQTTSIFRWAQKVPGPLKDVIQTRAIKSKATQESHYGEVDGTDLTSQRSASGGYCIQIATVFDKGTWVEMCQYLSIPVNPGKMYGGIKISSLKYTISHFLEDDHSSPKIPQLLVLIKSMRYVGDEIVAVFHDPTGEIEGYCHRDIVEQIGPALVSQTGLILRNVSVFSADGGYKYYLNIIPRNLYRVFVNDPALFETIRDFNEQQSTIEIEEAPTNDQFILANSAMRNTSTELSFISQRQVVFRNPPAKKTAEEAVTKATGRWQWSELLNNRAVNSESKENDRPSTTANPRSRVTFALNLDNSKEEEGEEVEVFSQGLLEECTGDTPASPNALSKSQSVNPTTSDLSPNPVERPIEDSSLEPAPKLSAVTIESYTNNDSLDALDAGLNDDDW